MDVRKRIGNNHLRLRKLKGLTQEQVAERSGFSQKYLSDLERGKRNPTVITLYELACVFEVDVTELLSPEN